MSNAAKLSKQDFLEEIEFLLSQGVSPLMICEQLGSKPDTVERRLQRYKMFDLARQFDFRASHHDLRVKTRFTN
jgi:IS30 family transposase